MTKIKLTYLYPDICGLYGDRGNVLAFRRVCEQMGLEPEIERIDNTDQTIDFDGSDILFLSPGELSVFPSVIAALEKNRAALDQFLAEGKYFFAIGSAACVFADEVRRAARPSYPGLGIGGFDCVERDMIYGDDLIFTCRPTDTEREVAGIQIQTVDIHPKAGSTPFGAISYGYGNNHSQTEGIRHKNLIVTNALGPAFVKNPWLWADILADIAAKKGAEVTMPEFELEKKSLAAVKAFNAGKKTNL